MDRVTCPCCQWCGDEDEMELDDEVVIFSCPDCGFILADEHGEHYE